jgi:DNA-binding NarL/FixJ family response regulator
MTGDDRTRVVLVDDEALYRDLLRVALEGLPELRVVGAFGDGASALAAAPWLAPRVAVLDIELPGQINGIQLGLMLRRQLPDLGIVLLSNHADPNYLTALPAEQMAGWSYLLKKSVRDLETLGRAVKGAAERQSMMDPQVVTHLRPKSEGSLARLTARQTEILSLMAQGLTNAAIARKLVLAEKSVENQINLLYQNLGIDRERSPVHPRVQATLIYLRESRMATGA